MPRRMTATEKWQDTWFRRLKPSQKLMWLWMVDQCDIAGTLDIDLDLASFVIGTKVTLDGFEGRLLHINDTRYWIPGFIQFQQGVTLPELNPENKAHLGIIRIATKYNLTEVRESPLAGATEGLPSPPSIGIGIGIGKGNVGPRPVFVAPTMIETELFMERSMPALTKRCPGALKTVFPKQEAPKFFTYWSEREWLVKGKKMKSWQQAAYNWLIKSYQYTQERSR
jgi:hypothetical protein